MYAIFMDTPDELEQKMPRKYVPLLLITANVGSLFEDPIRLLQPWLREFLKTISQLQPRFLALHLQEVGGKTYEKSLEHVQEFIRFLCESDEMQEFSFIRVYMDEDFNSAEHFTALGNLYFAHRNLSSLRIWNFLTHDWETVDGKTVYSGNIEAIATKEKSKFPQHFFPECKWSRKGFMRTRWEINQTIIDLVNIHLFHDASNLAACEEFPSVYCKTRRRALVHTLERFHLDEKNGFAPYIVFGDFNFRCDTEGVVKELTGDLTAHRVESIQNESTKVHYRNRVGNNVLTVGKKEFNHADHQLKFKETWLKKFDREMEAFHEILVEYPIEFSPSYPYEEDPEMPSDYMSTRCPSWCDRILMSPEAKTLAVDHISTTNSPYNIIGENVCMGDHKPVYLIIGLKPNKGTYRCCNCYLSARNNKSTSPTNPAVTLFIETDNRCPYKNKTYCKFLNECRKLNEIYRVTVERHRDTVRNNLDFADFTNPLSLYAAVDADTSSEQIGNTVSTPDLEPSDQAFKCPPVSINIIDSDNICVCMCAQQKCSNNEDDMDGNICVECRNIIKKQPLEPRYRIISKLLMLSNDIIVNRIDTQYLSTNSDFALKRQDPYTPESVESHSPNPELNSITITATDTSISHSPCHSIQQLSEQPPTEKGGYGNKNKAHHMKNDIEDAFESQQRGIVLPGQLKLRLEDLQRTSMHCLGRAKDAAAGDSDVDSVVDGVRRSISDLKKRNSYLPQCCTIL